MDTASDKALQRFAELMIEKIQQVEDNWQQPWFSTKGGGLPQNIDGRNYNGVNSFMLFLLTEKEQYGMPVYMTFMQAKEKGLKIGVGKFPWAASGRAIGLGRTEGFTKLIFDDATHRVIGGGIVGVHAGELISEVALAIEMGAEVGDIGHTIHPHPTLAESVGMAAEVFDGTITDLYIPRRK